MRITRVAQRSHWSAVLVTLAALLILASVCSADVKIVSEVTVTGGPSQNQLRMPRSPQEAGPSNDAPERPPVKPATPAHILDVLTTAANINGLMAAGVKLSRLSA